MKKYIFCLLIVTIGLLIFFEPVVIAPVCGPMASGGWMKCRWMGEAVRLIGAVVILLGIIFGYVKAARVGIAFANIVLSAGLILLPTYIIGTCKSASMPCNMYTKPTIILFAALLFIINALYLFLNRREW